MTADTPKKRLLRVALIGGGLLVLLAGYGVFFKNSIINLQKH